MTKSAQRVHADIESGKLTGDRLNEALTWLASEAERDAYERKRKRYSVQLATLFATAIAVLVGVTVIAKWLIHWTPR
jgi:hypothetical protein